MGLADLETIPETGAVFTIGHSRFADNVASHFFIRKDPVVSITCGDEHSAVICQTGRLFVFGSNDWGQLGLGHKNHVSKPSCVKALKPEKVTHVACGRAHTLICTGAQKIYACGSDQEGQLGRGTSAIGDSVNTPVLVYDAGLAGSKIVQIAAGSHHSLALTNDGGVFAWGSNLEGQLGLPDVSGLVNKPTKVHVPEPVKQISAGYYHSMFLTESGLIYVCGESESGKLGIDVNFSTQVAPKQMQLPSPAVHVACGGHHTVILADNGNLYCTGSNSSGQLGLGTSVTELHTPKLLPRGAIQNEKVTRISCGESHTAIVTDAGKLYTCGDGWHGKLGLEENENNVHEFTLVQRYNELFVSNVACGGCHTILLGRRRETNQTETDNSQAEHVQKKKNSLPPLKIPLSRLQSETRDDTVNQIIKEQLSPEVTNTDPVANAQPMIEKASEKMEEIANNKDNVTSHVTDPVNNTEESERSTKENTEGQARVSPEKESLDSASNEMKTEKVSKEMADSVEKSQESQAQNEDKEPKNDNDKSEMEVDKENNVQKEKESDSMNNKNDHENNNETNEKTIKSDPEMHEEANNKNDTTKSEEVIDGKEVSNEDLKSEPINEQLESKDDNLKEEKSSEEQTAPMNSTPPPKPPRLKPESGNSSNERSPMMDKENTDVDAKNEAKKDNASERNDASISGKKEESASTKSASSKSTKSKIGTDETIEIDKQDDKEQIIEEEKMNSDNVQDDADIVQSPPARTSKMSKIFKSSKEKKSEMENNTKTNGTTSHKPKSKTCTIL